MFVLYKTLFRVSFYYFESGTHLLSHIVSNIVPSAAYVLTIVFGMGTGVSHKRIGTGISKPCIQDSTVYKTLTTLTKFAYAH